MPATKWRKSAFLTIIVAAACATTAPGQPLSGSWGGRHVGLDLGPEGGRLEYDCADGTISEPIILDRHGRFAAAGAHRPGLGGPDRIDHAPPSYAARYSGRVQGEVMTLQVEIPAQGLSLGPFRLERGASPALVRCL